MGLANELGYEFPRPARFQRVIQAFGASRAGAWIFSRLLRHLDDLVAKVSARRASAPGLLAGLPVLDLTTIGRKSGQPRTCHLIAIPYAGDLALLGTNFGQASTPPWALNLEENPTATVSFGGADVDVVARAATEEEQTEIFATADGIYRGYGKYRQRVTGRRIRVFILTAATATN